MLIPKLSHKNHLPPKDRGNGGQNSVRRRLETGSNFSALLRMLSTQMNLHHQYEKAILAGQGARPAIFDNFHGLSLKLIVNYVTLKKIPNTFPLLVSLLLPKVPGCLYVVTTVPLLVSLIVSVPIFVAAPLLTLVVTVTFLVESPILPLFITAPLFVTITLITL